MEECEISLSALLKDQDEAQRKIYKKAINIRVAIDSIRHQKREIANLLNCEYNKVLFHTATSQGEQAKILSNLSSDLSSKITKKYAWIGTMIGAVIGVIVSLAFFFITKHYTYSPETDIQAIKENQTKMLNQIIHYESIISKQSLIMLELQKSIEALSETTTED